MTELKLKSTETKKPLKYGWYILAGMIYYPIIESDLPTIITTPVYLGVIVLTCYVYYKIKDSIHFIRNDILKSLMVGIPLWMIASVIAGVASVYLYAFLMV